MDKERVLKGLKAIVGEKGVLHRLEDVIVYEQDAFVMRALPDFVVFPTSTKDVQGIVRFARSEGLPIVARGAGTSVSGGAIPVTGGIIVSFSRMNHVLEVDAENRCAVVEPGVINLDITRAVSPYGYFYAPDPSSQMVCTIGGNVAENAGGIHGVAYGVTTNHILGLEVVLADGEVVELGGKSPDSLGYDLVGLVVGSEGTLGIVTKITVKLTRRRESVATMVIVFKTLVDASRTVAEIVARGVLPSSMELMDEMAVEAVEKAIHYGFPPDAGAVLLVELEGLTEAIDRPYEMVKDIAERNRAREIRTAATEEERQHLWKGRKGVFAAVSIIAPNQFTQDGCVPRPKLPEVLEKIGAIAERYSLAIANVAHAGDGNLHPLIMFDPREPGELEKVIEAGAEILRLCVEVGGTITGEHGIGIEKNDYMSWLFSAHDIEAMKAIKSIFDPEGMLNPGKIFVSELSPNEIRTESIGATAGKSRRGSGMWV